MIKLWAFLFSQDKDDDCWSLIFEAMKGNRTWWLVLLIKWESVTIVIITWYLGDNNIILLIFMQQTHTPTKPNPKSF